MKPIINKDELDRDLRSAILEAQSAVYDAVIKVLKQGVMLGIQPEDLIRGIEEMKVHHLKLKG